MFDVKRYYSAAVHYFNWERALSKFEDEFRETSEAFDKAYKEYGFSRFFINDFYKQILIALLIYKVYNPEALNNKEDIKEKFKNSSEIKYFLQMNYDDNIPDYIPELFMLFIEKLDFNTKKDELTKFFLDEMTSLKYRRKYKTQTKSLRNAALTSDVRGAYENYIKEGYQLDF